jgi:hypothetical protein
VLQRLAVQSAGLESECRLTTEVIRGPWESSFANFLSDQRDQSEKRSAIASTGVRKGSCAKLHIPA